MKQYFTKSEFACKCGCGLNNMDATFIEEINIARHLAGIPFVITSAMRCIDHNASVGGASDSSHTKGLAVDIMADNSQSRLKVIQALVQVGFTRIGIHKTFIHVDDDLDKPKDVCWLYK